MKSAQTAVVISLLGIILLCSPSVAEQTYLHADFNDKTIDEPIGMGFLFPRTKDQAEGAFWSSPTT